MKAHLDLARRHRAELRFSTPALSWRRDGAGVAVETEQGIIRAGAMILTPGPWAPQALAELGLPPSCRRIVATHLDAVDPAQYPAADLSVCFWMTPQGVCAGFPYLEEEGIEVMRHDRGEGGSPETVRREVSAEDTDEVVRFLAKYSPRPMAQFARRRPACTG